MEGWQLAIILKPIGLLIIFGAAWFIAKPFRKYLPEGRLKRFLFFSWKV